MPSLNQYKKMLSLKGNYNGQVRKSNADLIVESTWYNDLATRTCYLFDYYHDPQPLTLNDLAPDETMQIPIDLKYIVYSSQTFDKDAITYHVMFKPSEERKSSMVDYYEEFFGNRYDARYPCGLYVLIPDDKGIYNKWLIVGTANYNDPQFPTYEVLRCDKVFQWIYENKKYQICGALRSQNSYNSGIWKDRKVTIVEDQQKLIVPLNRDTETLSYNLRMIIDNKVLTEPRAWRVSKVNRVTSNGLAHITLAQDFYDEHTDYIEFDENNNIVGMWADYFTQGQVLPTDIVVDNNDIHSEITYSGAKPEIKVGGSYKKYSVNLYNKDTLLPYTTSVWKYEIRDGGIITAAPSNILTILTSQDSSDIAANQIKIKFDGGNSYIGKVLVISNEITYNGDTVKSSVEIDIRAL